ncbi:hypothetical protein K431DRAFT_342743 [Polychaeton citri CBS 116435]|uniref:Fungal N-terminal domain-containing protein n=1 Tax=Polychaeton citri CBS 116435 TaxID=1314669 RepID=A0A9P4QHK0_9PEZI|nr:hypothetical protein K431DRAFT_342743 [Polychaeton citri CBS 116435]
MAEIGLVASIIAVAGLGAKIGLTFYKIADELGSAGTEARTIGQEITTFSHTLTAFSQSIKGNTLNDPHLYDVAQSLFQNCRANLDDLDNLVTPVDKPDPAQSRRQSLKARWKWFLGKAKVSFLRSSLDSFKTTLLLLIGTLNYREAVDGASSRATIDALKAQVEALVDSATHANDRLAEIQNAINKSAEAQTKNAKDAGSVIVSSDGELNIVNSFTALEKDGQIQHDGQLHQQVTLADRAEMNEISAAVKSVKDEVMQMAHLALLSKSSNTQRPRRQQRSRPGQRTAYSDGSPPRTDRRRERAYYDHRSPSPSRRDANSDSRRRHHSSKSYDSDSNSDSAYYDSYDYDRPQGYRSRTRTSSGDLPREWKTRSTPQYRESADPFHTRYREDYDWQELPRSKRNPSFRKSPRHQYWTRPTYSGVGEDDTSDYFNHYQHPRSRWPHASAPLDPYAGNFEGNTQESESRRRRGEKSKRTDDYQDPPPRFKRSDPYHPSHSQQKNSFPWGMAEAFNYPPMPSPPPPTSSIPPLWSTMPPTEPQIFTDNLMPPFESTTLSSIKEEIKQLRELVQRNASREVRDDRLESLLKRLETVDESNHRKREPRGKKSKSASTASSFSSHFGFFSSKSPLYLRCSNQKSIKIPWSKDISWEDIYECVLTHENSSTRRALRDSLWKLKVYVVSDDMGIVKAVTGPKGWESVKQPGIRLITGFAQRPTSKQGGSTNFEV